MELWFTERHTPHVKFSIRVDKQLYSAQSEFQRIDIFESTEFGRFLTLDGYMMLTEKDEFIYHEMITHVPLAVHPHVQDVLVIGAGDGGVQEAVGGDVHAHGFHADEGALAGIGHAEGGFHGGLFVGCPGAVHVARDGFFRTLDVLCDFR